MKFELPSLQDFQDDSENRMNRILKDANVFNSRELILSEELNDFKKLQDLEFLNELRAIILNRYKLEKRNSLNSEVDRRFLAVCNSINELIDFEKSQLSFYEKRIFTIESELEKIKNSKE